MMANEKLIARSRYEERGEKKESWSRRKDDGAD
jgi:hypothetical protein